jgi:hypothetical protein
MNRSEYMSVSQQKRWALEEERIGRKLPRTHENCVRVLKVARPGKTAKDRAGGKE